MVKNKKVIKEFEDGVNTFYGGQRVITPQGKKGYVYQQMFDKIRVTSKRQTGLIGWFKPEQLRPVRKYTRK